MAIEVTETSTKHVKAETATPAKAGGIEIEFTADASERYVPAKLPGTVQLRVFSVDSVVTVEINPEDIERAGKLMELARNELHDFRLLCMRHGYHPGVCPQCREERIETTPAVECVATVEPPSPADMPF